MPKAASPKCLQCAKLSFADAIALHGPDGSSTKCWVGDKCPGLRYYHRNGDRLNKDRRDKYQKKTGKTTVVLAIAPPAIAFAELHLYRARVDAPLHAIGAELRMGEQVVAMIETVHVMGLSAAQVKEFLQEVLLAFSAQVGIDLGKFEGQQERSPGRCPICGGNG